MSYNIIAGLDGIKREIELLLDSPADLIQATAEAQPAPGSIAYTADHSFQAMLGPDGVWHQISGGVGDTTGRRIVSAIADLAVAMGGESSEQSARVSSLDATGVAYGTVVEAVGVPVYVSDVTLYPAYNLTDTGWYVFARITAKGDALVTAETTVTGAAGAIITPDADHVDVAVLFGVEAYSQTVVVDWGAYEETFVFKASDLAVRNLDYRTTFYVYDIAPFVTWTYALTTDTTFAAGKNYYTKDGDTYTMAEVTAGEAVPANTYYNHSKLHIEGMTRNITYRLDEIVDCPSEIVLPVIDDDTHGCWFEIQMRHSGSYSMTLLPPEGVKVATEHTQAESAGMNMIDLHYMNIDGVKLWRFMNTHSTIPTT